MTDPSVTSSGQQPATSQSGSAGLVVDKAKSAEQYIKDAEAQYIVPALVREKFPDLIKLIFETESMNGEEREYWLQIMPIMSEEQIVKFRDILVNEKQQLEKLDKDYKNDISRMGAVAPVQDIDEEALREKMVAIQKSEQVSESSEKAEEDKLLQNLQNL